MSHFLPNKSIPKYFWRVIFAGILLAITVDRFFLPVVSSDEAALVAENYRMRHPDRVMPDFAFHTDGCSLWPDGWWIKCCREHDEIYWGGGTIDEKRAADSALLQCVNTFVPGMGNFMWLGVRIGGGPILPTPWRFGYGFVYPHGYDE